MGGRYVAIINGSYSGKFGRITAYQRDNRFSVELLRRDGSQVRDEKNNQKIIVHLREAFFEVLINVSGAILPEDIDLKLIYDTQVKGQVSNTNNDMQTRLDISFILLL